MRASLLVAVLLVAVSVILMGCGGSECEADSECTSVGQCKQPRCVDGLCQSVPKPDCCGNRQCEEDAGENPCTCEQDCSLEATEDGTCSGTVMVPHYRITDRMVEAKHARYYCEDDKCMLGAPESEVDVRKLFSTHRADRARLEITGSVSQPYVVGDGVFNVRVKLTDLLSDYARLPVKLTSIQVLTENELMAEKELSNVELVNIGSSYSQSLVLSPAMDQVEERRSLSIRVSYEYLEVIRDEEDVVRGAVAERYDDLYFINPETVS